MDEGERGFSADGGRGHRTPQAKVGGADVGMTSRRNGRRKARHFLSAKLGGCKEETPNEKSAALKYRERDDEKASPKEGFENGESRRDEERFCGIPQEQDTTLRI